MAEPFYIESGTGKQLSASQLTPGQTYTQSGTGTSYTAPASQAAASPAPQMSTPPAPGIGQTPVPQTNTATTQPATVQNQAPQPTAQPTATQPATQQAALTMPPTGSVVDLLNGAGQDSSYAARQQLAQQYGIQNYQGTAAQNTELSQKYLNAYNTAKGTPPTNGADARTAVGDLLGNQNADLQQDPQATFIDAVSSMNPVVSSLYSQINQILSSPITTQTFSDQYQQLTQQQGIPALQTQLMNVQNLMDGTEDSIRQEITAVGGSATENQVQALAAARNKTFLQQASQLQQQLAIKQDYVNQIMQFSQADRAAVEKQVDRKLGLTTQLFDLQEKMTNAAKDNYSQIVQNLGYAGLASALKNDPHQQAQVEQLLGLGKGALSDPSFLGQEDAGKVLGSAATGYFTYNPYTGETTPLATGTTGGVPGGTMGGSSGTVGGAISTLNGKPLNDTQSTTLGYVQRLNDSNKTITDVGGKFTGAISTLGAYLPNILKSSDRQVYEQAQRNFINAVLRRESGAAISPSEFDSTAKQYFPQPGDSQAVVDQKTANRQRVISSLSQSANVPLSYVTGSQGATSGSYQDYLKAIGQ